MGRSREFSVSTWFAVRLPECQEAPQGLRERRHPSLVVCGFICSEQEVLAHEIAAE
jgi:hypothetical protein